LQGSGKKKGHLWSQKEAKNFNHNLLGDTDSYGESSFCAKPVMKKKDRFAVVHGNSWDAQNPDNGKTTAAQVAVNGPKGMPAIKEKGNGTGNGCRAPVRDCSRSSAKR